MNQSDQVSEQYLIEIAVQMGEVYARTGQPKEVNPFWGHTISSRDAFAKAYKEALSLPAYKPGDEIRVRDFQGNECLCTVGDIEEGDLVVFISRHGLRAEKPHGNTILPCEVKKIYRGSERVSVSRYGRDHYDRIKALGGGYLSSVALRWVG